MAAKRSRTPSRNSRPAKRRSLAASRLLYQLEAKQVELELQNEQLRSTRQIAIAALERYTEIFDFAPIGYATLDGSGAIIEVNLTGAQLLGVERPSLIGTRFEHHVSLDGRRRFEALVASVISRLTPSSVELELRRGTTIVPVRMTAGALRRGDPRVLIAFEDISERRAKELALARTEQALRETNRRKDDFLAMLSHELRNPLSPIRTSVGVLQLAEPGSDVAAQAIEMLDRSATHLTRLVDDLLDVSRITRGKIELRRAPVEIVSLVARTVEDHRGELTRRRLLLETDFAVPELWLDGDSVRLVQVLSNVLANAEKFTPAGGRITVSVDHVGDSAMIRVKDTGVGIAPEVIAELFEPFAQAPQSLDRNGGGLGLGLTMVKALMEMHGGRVSIRSAGVGKGAEVVLTLPADPRTAVESPVAESRSGRRRVLIVEDMHDSALSLQRVLQLKGHDVDVAYDGKSGLEKVVTFRPEVVLCDIGLPDLDGFAFAMNVRAHRHPAPYLVALSGYARPEDIARAKAAGFDRHVAKPPHLEELDELLASVAVLGIGTHDTGPCTEPT